MAVPIRTIVMAGHVPAIHAPAVAYRVTAVPIRTIVMAGHVPAIRAPSVAEHVTAIPVRAALVPKRVMAGLGLAAHDLR